MNSKTNRPHSPSQPLLLARLGCLLSTMLLALHGTVGWAANGTWTNISGASRSWPNPNHWTNGVIADGSGFSATFVTSNANAVTLDGARTIGSLVFGNTTINSLVWTLNPGSGGPLTLAGGTRTISVNNFTTVNVVLAGTEGFTKAGNGSLTNTAVNTYSGGTTISAGKLTLSGSGTLGSTSGALNVLSNATLNLGGTSQTVGTVTITNGAIIQNGTLTGATYAAKGGTISAALAGSGTLTQSSNTLTLSGNNTLTGPVLINGGSLQIGGGTTGTLSSASSIMVTNNAQLVYTTTTAVTNDASLTLTGYGSAGSVLPWMGALLLNGNGGDLTQNGPVTLAPVTAGQVVRIGGYGTGGAFTLRLNGAISGNGSLSLYAQDGDNRFFLNQSSTYTGGTTLDTAGNTPTVNQTILGVDNALPVTTVLTNGASTNTSYSQLVLNGHSQTLAGIVSLTNWNNVLTNRITGSHATLSTLTVSNAADCTYIGVLGGPDVNDNNLALVKAGPGTLTLTRVNTYTNGTTVTNGTLLVNGSIRTGVFVKSGATLGGSGTSIGAVNVYSGATLKPGLGGTDSSPLAIANTLTLYNGSTTLIAINRDNSPNASTLTNITTLTRGGTLTVTNVGPALQANDSFTLISADSRSGNFSASNFPSLDAGLNWWPTGNNWDAIFVNQSPTANDTTYWRGPAVSNYNLKISIAEVLTNVVNRSAGQTITLTGVGPSGQGADISTNSSYILYSPVLGNTNNDSFTYTISDGRGGTATGTNYVNYTNSLFLVDAYGATNNGLADDSPMIRVAISNAMVKGAGAVVAFQAGNYDLSHDNRSGYNTNFCLNINSASGLTLQGSGTNGTKLIVTEPLTGGLVWSACTNCVVRGITVDYDPLPFTQGTITNVDLVNHTFDLILHSNYPSLEEARFTNAAVTHWGLIMDAVNRQPKAGAADFVPVSSWTKMTGNTYRIIPTTPGVANQVAVNDRFVYIARNNSSTLRFSGSVNCVVEDVTVHAGPSAGIVSQQGGGLQIRRFSLSFPAGSDRLLTTDSDGFHCQQNRVGPVVADSYFEGMADDTVNIYCPPNVVYQVIAPTNIVVGKSTLMQAGDRIQIFNPTNGTIRAETIATNVSVINGTNYQLILSNAIPGMVAGNSPTNADCIYDLDASGEGYVISNNVVNPHRRFGILLRAGNGMVVSNVINGTSCQGIVVMNDHGSFYEGPLASNVVIRGNTITGVGYANSGSWYNYGAIRVDASKYGGTADGYGQRNITIEGNIISNWARVAIYAQCVTNLQIQDNQIQSSPTDNSYSGDIRGMVFGKGTAIVVDGTTITDPRTNLKAGIHVLHSVVQGTNGFYTNNLTFNLASGRTNILDERDSSSSKITPRIGPSIAPIPTQTVMPGSTLGLSISATPQPLSFQLASALKGAAVDKGSGVFTWRPTVAQSGTTNQVVVEVQDNGSPNLSATQTFQVIVLRPAQPSMSSVVYGSNQLCLNISGQAGLDYIVQAATNLSNPDWVGVWTNPAAVPPLGFTNTLPPNVKQQFYRVLLGP